MLVFCAHFGVTYGTSQEREWSLSDQHHAGLVFESRVILIQLVVCVPFYIFVIDWVDKWRLVENRVLSLCLNNTGIKLALATCLYKCMNGQKDKRKVHEHSIRVLPVSKRTVLSTTTLVQNSHGIYTIDKIILLFGYN